MSQDADEPPEESVGDRIFLVRAALGSSVRTPLALDRFAELLNAACGERRYDNSKLSLLERGKRKPTLEDVRLIASLDPQKRGRDWLGHGDWLDPGAQPFPRLGNERLPPVITKDLEERVEPPKRRDKRRGA
jgi:hypothetical protein